MRTPLKSMFAIVALLTACAGPAQMQAGPTVLGAEGEVKVAEGPNGNTQVKIIIRHLADPSVISEGARVYVAWIQPSEGGMPQNAGQIRLNKNREGVLETATPFRSFKVIVTAEQRPTAPAPSSNPVLSTLIASN